jgi:hypothetical protein
VFGRREFDFPFYNPRTVLNLAWRCVGFVWARLRRPSVAWAVVPNLATHAELDMIAEGLDWAAVAESVDRA